MTSFCKERFKASGVTRSVVGLSICFPRKKFICSCAHQIYALRFFCFQISGMREGGGKVVFILADERETCTHVRDLINTRRMHFFSMFGYELKRVKFIIIAKMCKSVRCCEHVRYANESNQTQNIF